MDTTAQWTVRGQSGIAATPADRTDGLRADYLARLVIR